MTKDTVEVRLKKYFLSLKDIEREDIEKIFSLADKFKTNRLLYKNILDGKSVVLIFQKPSIRTRVSFDIGIKELGGFPIYLSPEEAGMGQREEIRDIARVLSVYAHCIVARVFSHHNVEQLAKYSNVPVINALSDREHPCQALGDIFTMLKLRRKLKGINLGWIGDGNNVLHSLLYGCAYTGVNIICATPKAYEPHPEIIKEAKKIASRQGSKIILTNNPEEAASMADFIYTDVWASMGQEKEAETRKKAFKDFQVNSQILKIARPTCRIMHCLPAHRGEEITDEVMESRQSIVFEQAENRLHIQKAILAMLVSKVG
jgi:ornithine carbamoyltransferase